MSTKYPGGVISKTAPTPSGPYADSTAPGIWTLEQQAYWQKLGQWPTQGNVNPSAFIENLFSTYLYTGNGSTQTITNGIDLSTYGGLVWAKSRSSADNHGLYDTARGVENRLISNNTAAQSTASGVTAFNTNGFSLGSNSDVNGSAKTTVSWTFRKQPKFFDVVTGTGSGTFNHNLQSVPGCIILKRTDGASSWFVRHNGLTGGITGTYDVTLNTTAAQSDSGVSFNPTSTQFTVPAGYISAGETWVAYLFAHDAGGFGLTGTDNVISCGSYTGNGSSTGPTITLGYEPQWVLIKNTYDAYDWQLYDVMRGMSDSATGSTKGLSPNTSAAEVSRDKFVYPTATGFAIGNGTSIINQPGQTMIYIAIRRGPMAVPTLGTSVFYPLARTGNNTQTSLTGFGFPPDLAWTNRRDGAEGFTSDKLRGPTKYITSQTTAAEGTYTSGLISLDQNGVTVGTSNEWNAPTGIANWFFRRAPSFFDEVCYTGTGNGVSSNTVNHNLGVVPELCIFKCRSNSAYGKWGVSVKFSSTDWQTGYLYLTDAFTDEGDLSSFTPSTATTIKPFYLMGGNGYPTASGQTYVAYLFASCPGVSKVGTYTGTGTTKQVDCGFTSGARFVLIKRTDSTGDWYVWDSARGIVAGNDPYLLLNSTAAEVTGTDYVDTYSAGFEISSTAPSAINASGGTFIFLAIA